jgi:hypothetical protein
LLDYCYESVVVDEPTRDEEVMTMTS